MVARPLQREVPLLPSFSIKGETGIRAFSDNQKYKGSVVYRPCAELQRNKRFARTKRAKGGIPVTQCRTKAQAAEDDANKHAVTCLQRFEHLSSRLQVDCEKQSRSLPQWTTDSFTKRAPRIHFEIIAQASTLLRQDQAILIQIGLTVERTLTKASPPLQFKFITVRFGFKAVTQLSVSYIWEKGTVTPSDVVFARNLEMEAAETIWKGDDEPITIKRNVLPPKRDIWPSSKATYIDKSYFEELLMDFEIGGKPFEEKFGWSLVTLLTKEAEMLGEGDEIVAGLNREPDMTSLGSKKGGGVHGSIERY